MFLFKMHSIGSVRPVPRASAMANQWLGSNRALPVRQESIKQSDPTNHPEPKSKELEEDVVIIQEEEMVLVRQEQQQQPEEQQQQQPEEQTQEQVPQQDEQPQPEEPQPKCSEPESTVVEPLSKPKNKKKNQKRK